MTNTPLLTIFDIPMPGDYNRNVCYSPTTLSVEWIEMQFNYETK